MATQILGNHLSLKRDLAYVGPVSVPDRLEFRKTKFPTSTLVLCLHSPLCPDLGGTDGSLSIQHFPATSPKFSYSPGRAVLKLLYCTGLEIRKAYTEVLCWCCTNEIQHVRYPIKYEPPVFSYSKLLHPSLLHSLLSRKFWCQGMCMYTCYAKCCREQINTASLHNIHM